MPRPTAPPRLTLPAVLLALLAAAAAAPARDLHWRAVEVRARLDAEGVLHVLERQAMVFTGDWNGGERIFRVLPGQSLALEGLSRIAPDGRALPLLPGDLSAVDRYAWKDSRTLRWRSRLPGDPPFERTELVYEIAYTLSGILLSEEGRFVLDHDFAFPDRTGPIEKFTLELALDPVWRPERPWAGSLSRERLLPGESVVVRLPLSRVGAGRPAAARRVAGRTARLAFFLLLVAATAALSLSFRSREKALGRFEPLPPLEAIDEQWLQRNLLSLAPEEAGALWDEKVGAPEVAAVLARLASEKKIETRVEGKSLAMRLLVAPEQLSGYDRELVQALFFGGRKETDTDAIRKHYRSSGFDPAAKIRPGLESKLASHPDFRDRSPRPTVWPASVPFLAGVAALVLSVIGGGEQPGTVVGTGIFHLLLWGLAAGCGALYRNRVDRLGAFAPLLFAVPLLLLFLSWRGFGASRGASRALVAGVFLLRLAIIGTVFALAKTRSGPRRLARRKALTAARNFFREELRRPAPRLADGWFPYVVAFGLTGAADRWFRAHGGASSAGRSESGSGSSSGSSTASSRSWTGGGGAFGGAGASSSWTVAAGAVAAGVSAPSSGSGGGGGGGGGSSGGGGGGGW
ncbi:MAG: hypothetical protein ACRD3M_10045 [Thermoanaerobaculia bacterium]